MTSISFEPQYQIQQSEIMFTLQPNNLGACQLCNSEESYIHDLQTLMFWIFINYNLVTNLCSLDM